MSAVPKTKDAYGAQMLAHAQSKGDGHEIVERDDGLIAIGGLVSNYFAPYRAWRPIDKQAARMVRGRVLDVGSGAGRVSLHLQSKGHDVVGIDNSPGAVRLSRQRGVIDVRALPFTQISRKLGTFDTVVLFGNNLGLFGRDERTRWLLRRLKTICPVGARIIGQTMHPYTTRNPDHLAYHRRNRAAGRPGGLLRLRIRHNRIVGPWFDYRLFTQNEIRSVVRSTNWSVDQFIGDTKGSYFVVLERQT